MSDLFLGAEDEEDEVKQCCKFVIINSLSGVSIALSPIYM